MAVIAIVVLASFLVAGFMRWRRIRALPSIFGAALVVPAAVAFSIYVYPGGAEGRMWAMIAIPVSYAWGLVAAGVGYAAASLMRRGKEGETPPKEGS